MLGFLIVLVCAPAAEPPAMPKMSPPDWEQRYGALERSHILGPAVADGGGAAWLPVTSFRPDLDDKDARASVWKIDLATGRRLREVAVGVQPGPHAPLSPHVRGLAPLDGGDLLLIEKTAEDGWRVMRLTPEGERQFEKPLFPDPAGGEGVWEVDLLGMVRLSEKRFVAFGGGLDRDNGADGLALGLDDRGEVLWRRTWDAGGNEVFSAGASSDEGSLLLAGITIQPGGWEIQDKRRARADAWVVAVDPDGELRRQTRFPGTHPAIAVDRTGRPTIGYLRPADQGAPAFACAVCGLSVDLDQLWETTAKTSDWPLRVPAVAASPHGPAVAVSAPDGLELAICDDEGERTAGRTWAARATGFRGTSLVAHGDRLIAFTLVAEERPDGVRVERPAGVAFDLSRADDREAD